jgi:AraC-like DNA-binding protein
MATEPVRMWRAPGGERVLLMASRTTQYAMEPRGEYVFGIVGEQPMRSRRGRERRLVRPGQLVAWDPSHAHAGSAVDERPWKSRLVVIEVADLAALADDPESDPLGDIRFPDPVLSDTALAAGFLRLHATLESPSTRLEQDERLAQWLRVLIDRSSAVRSARPAITAGDEGALGLAFAYLADQPERNIGLDELATAAGIGKFRLIRLFRERTGLPPHALQIAHRIRARRMLEVGATIAQTAAARASPTKVTSTATSSEPSDSRPPNISSGSTAGPRSTEEPSPGRRQPLPTTHRVKTGPHRTDE